MCLCCCWLLVSFTQVSSWSHKLLLSYHLLCLAKLSYHTVPLKCKLPPSREKRDSSREKRDSSREKQDSSRRKRELSREKRDSSRECTGSTASVSMVLRRKDCRVWRKSLSGHVSYRWFFWCDWSSIFFSTQWAIFVLHVLIDLIGICFVCASELKMKLRAGYLHRRRHAHV